MTTASVAGRGTMPLDLASMGLETVGVADQIHIVGTKFIVLGFTTC